MRDTSVSKKKRKPGEKVPVGNAVFGTAQRRLDFSKAPLKPMYPLQGQVRAVGKKKS